MLLQWRANVMLTHSGRERSRAAHTRDTKETHLDIRRESSKLDRRWDFPFLEPFRGCFQVIANGERALSGGVLQFYFRIEQYQRRRYVKVRRFRTERFNQGNFIAHQGIGDDRCRLTQKPVRSGSLTSQAPEVHARSNSDFFARQVDLIKRLDTA